MCGVDVDIIIDVVDVFYEGGVIVYEIMVDNFDVMDFICEVLVFFLDNEVIVGVGIVFDVLIVNVVI